LQGSGPEKNTVTGAWFPFDKLETLSLIEGLVPGCSLSRALIIRRRWSYGVTSQPPGTDLWGEPWGRVSRN